MLSGPARKGLVLLHIVSSVGWMGAVIPYVLLAVSGIRSDDIAAAAATLLWMKVFGYYVLIPLSLAAWLSGWALSLVTGWGFFRYRWIVSKLILTTISVGVLMRHLSLVASTTGLAQSGHISPAQLHALRMQLIVHPVGGLLVLILISAISVFRPWGLTRYGQKSVPILGVDKAAGQRSREAAHSGRSRSGRLAAIIGAHAVVIGGIHLVLLHRGLFARLHHH